MKNYEVRLEYGFSMVVTVRAASREEARKLAKEKAVCGLEFAYDDKLIDDVSAPSQVDSFVTELEEIPFT